MSALWRLTHNGLSSGTNRLSPFGGCDLSTFVVGNMCGASALVGGTAGVETDVGGGAGGCGAG